MKKSTITKSILIKLKANPITLLDTLKTDEIAQLIQKANYEYHTVGKPIFTDDIYDIIKEYLKKKDPNNPILKSVGAVVPDDKRKVKLPYYLGSLDKIKTDEKLIQSWANKHKGTYIVSDKLDGISALICIDIDEKKDKHTVKMYSRGDGTIGQDISHLLPFIKNIPTTFKDVKYHIAIRGELLLSKNDFEKNLDKKGANARNTVAGIVNAKMPDLNIAKHIQFVAYELITPSILPSEQYQFLEKIGFKNVNHQIIQTPLTSEILSCILIQRRKLSEFEVDGIVVMHDHIYKRSNGENPSYAFAFKSVHTMESVEVIVKDVEWNISKDGYLKPVVIFDEVNLSGVVIKRASGMNAKYISDNIIGPGSRIVIIRSGDVIPYITSVLSPSGSGKPHMPSMPYEWNKTNIDIMVKTKDTDNIGEEILEVRFKNIEYFIKKMKVDGVSTGILRKMFDKGLNTLRKVIYVSKKDIDGIPGFKDKTVANIIGAFEKLRASFIDVNCMQIMEASNIFGRGIGYKKIELILTGSKDDIIYTKRVPTIEELVGIKGIEKLTAIQFIEGIPKFFAFLKENDIHVNACRKVAQSDNGDKTSSVNMIFKDAKIVFTGFRDAKLKEYIESHGGKVNDTITKNVSLVVRKDNEETSTKITKAQELNINIITLSEFKKRYSLSL